MTGTTSITSFGTNYKGVKYLRFAGAVALTHNSTTLLLPGGVNYTTAAGDTFIAYPKSTSGTADGWNLVLCSRTVVQSMIRLNTANGYGSTNTKIRRFTNTVTSQGADITYADSATLGASFTTVNAGVYAISFCDSGNAQTGVGISLNTTGPTTNIFALTISEVLAALSTTAADFGAEASWTGYLPAGSIIRAHTGGVPVGAIAQYTQFTITRIA